MEENVNELCVCVCVSLCQGACAWDGRSCVAQRLQSRKVGRQDLQLALGLQQGDGKSKHWGQGSGGVLCATQEKRGRKRQNKAQASNGRVKKGQRTLTRGVNVGVPGRTRARALDSNNSVEAGAARPCAGEANEEDLNTKQHSNAFLPVMRPHFFTLQVPRQGPYISTSHPHSHVL
jgi:hypothetical protein